MRKIIVLLSLLIILLHPSLSAQTWEIGVSAGATGYMGDLNPVKPYELNNPAYGGRVKYNINGYFGLKLAYLHGKTEAYDSLSNNLAQRERNLNFYSPLDELSLQLEFNFFNYMPTLSKKRFSPYLFAGISGFKFNPKTEMGGTVYKLRDSLTENIAYKTIALAIPVGVGVRYNIGGKWSLAAEFGFRTTFTDYLDDVSGVYPDFSSESIVRRALSDRSVYGPGEGTFLFHPGDRRGDSHPHDTYMFTGISLTYTIIPFKCYRF